MSPLKAESFLQGDQTQVVEGRDRLSPLKIQPHKATGIGKRGWVVIYKSKKDSDGEKNGQEMERELGVYALFQAFPQAWLHPRHWGLPGITTLLMINPLLFKVSLV